MARNPRKAAFCRILSATLTAHGFEEGDGGRAWWLRSELGDYIAVNVQSSNNSANVVYVNIAVVPKPQLEYNRWLARRLWPDNEAAAHQGPDPSIGYLSERVNPVDAPDTRPWDHALHTVELARHIGALVARDLADPIVPRFRRYLDRDMLLSTLDRMGAMAGVARWLRAAFLAETGDVEDADRVYGPADEDDENQARQRQFLREYALAHQ